MLDEVRIDRIDEFHMESIHHVYPAIRQIVTDALVSRVHGVTFSPEEVTIVTESVRTVIDDIGALPTGMMGRPVQIIVTANGYAWRLPIRDELARQIGEGIGNALPAGLKFSVSLLLPQAGFYTGES